ncbi:MAG: UbiX family flavin prenyltransferase [Rhodospirillaceae bacterium]|nr:UbiX family flavin prenyltransferase [Rhodospirillaceae bacterium]
MNDKTNASTDATPAPPVIVAISGASGAVYGMEILRALKEMNVPSHAIITEAGKLTLKHEMDLSQDSVRELAVEVHNIKDVGAKPASGSFRAQGMIVAPCSIKTLSGIAGSYAHNLLLRSADVMLKERLPLVLMVRETPLHKGHLELMTKAAEMGCVILPPVPAFYTNPNSIEDIVRHTVGRALDQIGLDSGLVKRWQGC